MIIPAKLVQKSMFFFPIHFFMWLSITKRKNRKDRKRSCVPLFQLQFKQKVTIFFMIWNDSVYSSDLTLKGTLIFLFVYCRHERVRPMIVDPALYISNKSGVVWFKEKRNLPSSFKIFVGTVIYFTFLLAFFFFFCNSRSVKYMNTSVPVLIAVTLGCYSTDYWYHSK